MLAAQDPAVTALLHRVSDQNRVRACSVERLSASERNLPEGVEKLKVMLSQLMSPHAVFDTYGKERTDILPMGLGARG